MKRIARLAVPLALALSLAACGSAATTTGAATSAGGDAAASGELQIAIIAKGYASPFWATVKAGSEKAGADLGVAVTFNGPDTELEIDRQTNLLQTALDRNPSALIFAALDSQASVPYMDDAKSRGIPVVAFDSGVDSDVPVTTIATDNVAAAAEGAKQMIALLDGKGQVAVLAHSQTSLTGKQRRDGFTDYLKENAPDIEIVDIQYSDSDQAKAQNQAAAILQANPELDGFFATDDDGAVAAANEVQSSGKEGISIIGFDSGAAQLDFITSGVIAGSITQNPYQMGYVAVEKAVAAVNGETLETFYDSGFAWYNADNMDDPEIASALYQ